jgi:hypothetical protein
LNEPPDWQGNYFNYFTEVEERFQRARGSGFFLLSPLDWALIETWKNSEIPLEAALRGIDAAFEKWRSRRTKSQRQINSLAYCAQAVAEEAQALAGAQEGAHGAAPVEDAPFTAEELDAHLKRIAAETRAKGLDEIALSLESIAAESAHHYARLQELEQRLGVLEEKALAQLRAATPEEALLEARRSMDLELRPYRSKFTADQLARLERQFLDRWMFERSGLPRYSIFYLR